MRIIRKGVRNMTDIHDKRDEMKEKITDTREEIKKTDVAVKDVTKVDNKDVK